MNLKDEPPNRSS
jgi:hypothetical protein